MVEKLSDTSDFRTKLEDRIKKRITLSELAAKKIISEFSIEGTEDQIRAIVNRIEKIDSRIKKFERFRWLCIFLMMYIVSDVQISASFSGIKFEVNDGVLPFVLLFYGSLVFILTYGALKMRFLKKAVEDLIEANSNIVAKKFELFCLLGDLEISLWPKFDREKAFLEQPNFIKLGQAELILGSRYLYIGLIWILSSAFIVLTIAIFYVALPIIASFETYNLNNAGYFENFVASFALISVVLSVLSQLLSDTVKFEFFDYDILNKFDQDCEKYGKQAAILMIMETLGEAIEEPVKQA